MSKSKSFIKLFKCFFVKQNRSSIIINMKFIFLSSTQKKVFYTIISDIKLIHRYYSIHLTVPLFWCIGIFITYYTAIIKPHMSLFITIFLLLVLYENIFNNMFARDEWEFRMYSIFPISFQHLVISKNISNFIVTALPLLVMNSGLFLIFKLSFENLFESLFFFLLNLFAIMAFGNYFSVRSQMGVKKRKEVSLGYLFMQQIIFGIVSGIYFFINNFINSGTYYVAYLGIIFCVYLFSMKYSINLLQKVKFLILE